MDHFEQQLQRQTMRSVPKKWRDEILGAAQHAREFQSSTSNPRPIPWWRELLWPCPQAWAGMAAVWMVIFFLNVVSREPAQIASNAGVPPTREVLMALREQRRLLAELIGSPIAIEQPKPFEPRPRSERSPQTVNV